MSEGDDLFSRWSSRKRAVAKEDAEKAASIPAEEEGAGSPEGHDAAGAPEESEDSILARFGLPSPESLGPGDDFSGFMQSGVPEFLRRRALRRLWRSNPVLANLDGLNDYDEDFTSPEETMKVLKTAYKVGRGFLRDPVEDVADHEQGGEDATASSETQQIDPAAAGDVDIQSTEQPPEDVAERDLPVADESSAHNSDDATGQRSDPTERKPRRMRFET